MLQIHQFIYPQAGELPAPETNILGQECAVVVLGVHASPGTQLCINENTNYLTIGNNGNYSINCEQFPITSLKIKAGNITNYPLIIDIVYNGKLNGNGGAE